MINGRNQIKSDKIWLMINDKASIKPLHMAKGGNAYVYNKL